VEGQSTDNPLYWQGNYRRILKKIQGLFITALFFRPGLTISQPAANTKTRTAFFL
jgi:hypothetical protein